MTDKSFHDEVKSLLDEAGVDYQENVNVSAMRKLNQAHMTGEELREQIVGVLQEALPELKKAVRSYMSQGAVHDRDFKSTSAIWRSLDSIEDATEKLSQSEF